MAAARKRRMLLQWSTLDQLEKKVNLRTAQNPWIPDPAGPHQVILFLKSYISSCPNCILGKQRGGEAEVIIVAQWLERLKRSIKVPAVKSQQRESHFPSITAEPAYPEDNTMYQKYPTCMCIAQEHVKVRILPAAEEPEQLHGETSAQPAVRIKQECCDTNSYGCTEGSRSIGELRVV